MAEANVHVELVGSDDVEITMDETTEREVEITSDKLDEIDCMMISTESKDHIRISSGGVNISHNVKQLVTLFEKYPNDHEHNVIMIQTSNRLKLVSTIIVVGPIR